MGTALMNYRTSKVLTSSLELFWSSLVSSFIFQAVTMSEWQNNDQARRRVQELLLKAGIPLELRVAEVCKQFEEPHSIDRMRSQKRIDMLHIESGRRVYEYKEQPDVVREIDRVISIYSNIHLSVGYDIHLSTHVVIECKHRDNLEIFGFEHPDNSIGFALPIISELTPYHKSSYMFGIKRGSEPYHIGKSPLCSMSLIEITGGATPHRVHEENLIYKAGAAICDYIMMAHNRLTVQNIAEYHIKRLGYEERFKTEYKVTWGGGEDSIINAWDNNDFINFNKSMNSFDIQLYVPIICIDSPLYYVAMEGGQIKGFAPARLLKSDLVLNSWPGNHKYYLHRPYSKPIVVTTNPENLRLVLDDCLKWHKNGIKDINQYVNKNALDALKWPLRSTLTRAWRRQNTIEP